MPKHPPDGILRRLLDEPVAVAVADEDHASRCLRCHARMSLMREDDAVVSLALGRKLETTPAKVALERLRTAERAGPALVPTPARGWQRDEVALGRPRRRRPLLRPTLIASALVLMGGATAAAASGLVPIFEPESVAPVVIQAGDIASLQALSRFGTVTGSSKLDLTPENSARALASAAGFTMPAVTAPPGLASASPSYWLVSPDYAQLRISVAKAEQAAANDRATVPPAPSGVDGAILRVATGPGALEVWGLSLPGDAGAGAPVPGRSVGVGVGSGSSETGSGPAATDSRPAATDSHPAASDIPQLAVAEVQGPTVSSSGAGISTLENYLLSQPGISAELAAQIRAIGDPSSTLPIPVPPRASSSTVDLNGHAAVVLGAGSEGTVVVWAEHGRLFAVLGQASPSDLLDVARQIA